MFTWKRDIEKNNQSKITCLKTGPGVCHFLCKIINMFLLWKLNVAFTHYPFTCLHKVNIMYRKPGFEWKFSRFLMYKYRLFIWFVWKWKKCVNERIRIPYTQHEFLTLNRYFSSFSNSVMMVTRRMFRIKFRIHREN